MLVGIKVRGKRLMYLLYVVAEGSVILTSLGEHGEVFNFVFSAQIYIIFQPYLGRFIVRQIVTNDGFSATHGEQFCFCLPVTSAGS